MRYTTIIDIRDYPQIYRSESCRLLYLHLVLASGYHVEDKDLCAASLRQLEAQTGLTFSAVRHALQQLQKAGLVTRQCDSWSVVKYCIPKDIATRPKPSKKAGGFSEEAYKIIHHEFTPDQKTWLYNHHKSEFMWVYENIHRLSKEGDTTVEKYLRANYSQYLAEWNKMKRIQENEQS